MSTGLDRNARASAVDAARMVAAGEALESLWRHVILQLLDDYSSELRNHGIPAAAAMWSDAPSLTGEQRLDAALAALAEHLARRDGWPVPVWANSPSRETDQWWFVTPLKGLHSRALVESPLSFRKRGVFITNDALSRV